MKKFLTLMLLSCLMSTAYLPHTFALTLTGEISYKDKKGYKLIRSLPSSYKIDVDNATITFDDLMTTVSTRLEIPRDKFELTVAENRSSDYSGHYLSDFPVQKFRELMMEMASETFPNGLTLIMTNPRGQQ